MERYRKGIFMVVYAIIDGKPQYVILRRKLHWVGWEFPKAGIEKGETKKQTVRREVAEETGLKILKITSHRYKGTFLYPKPLPDRPKIIGQTYYLYSVEVEKGPIKIDKIEHTSGRWVNYSTAMRMIKYQDQKDSLKIVNNWLKERISFLKEKELEKKGKIPKSKKR